MLSMQKPATVHATGAPAGSVLTGTVAWNQGLRLRVAQTQPRSIGGPIEGPFDILDAGDGKHAGALRPLLGRATDAAEVLRVIRRQFPQCVNVVNANILMVEKT
jgi:hypothetical protein